MITFRNAGAAAALALTLLAAGSLLPSRNGGGGREAAAVSPNPAARTPEQLVAELEGRIAAAPNDAALYAELGLAFLNQVKADADPRFYPRAEAAFRDSLRLQGDENFEALYGMATLAAGRHDFANALPWARRAIEANPYNADARGVEGDALLELGRYEDAERSFQSMIDLRPNVASFARVSYLRELRGDIPGAIEAMKLALESAGTSDDAAFALYHIGELYLGHGKPGPARRAFERGTQVAPLSLVPKAGLAKALGAQGRYAEGIALMEEVLLTNEEPGYAILLGDLRTANDDPGAAGAYDLARSLEEREEANGVNVNVESALFAAAHGEPEEALERAEKEYAARRSIHVADAYAWALYVNGRYRAADRVMREAFRIGTISASFEYHAGMIAARLGRDGEARTRLKTALRLDPAFSLVEIDDARQALIQLGGPSEGSPSEHR